MRQKKESIPVVRSTFLQRYSFEISLTLAELGYTFTPERQALYNQNGLISVGFEH